jgi:hypothetical protein
MHPGRLRLVLAIPIALVGFATTNALPQPGAPTARADVLSKIDPRLRAHVSGVAQMELGAAPRAQAQTSAIYFPTKEGGCSGNLGSNVKVNQNCLNLTDADLQGRGQAQNETSVAVDPNNPNHIVVGYNDYRIGDGNCGSSYSLDGGRSWTDTSVPRGFTRGGPFGSARQYWQAGGDPSVAWDSRGNAYISCQGFMRGGSPVTPNPDLSSAFVVFRSTANNGASWNFTGNYTTVANDVAGTGAILEDKALMAIDNRASSPFRDRIYETWTEFTATTAYIYEVSSTDYGQTFGSRHLVSVASALCPFPLNPGAGCDNNQGSQPFVGPDGTLYVVWSNYNSVDLTVVTPGPAKFQVLISTSKDGGSTFGAPQRVGFYYELPDCATYQGGKDLGRACIPEKGPTSNSVFRATSYPAGAVNPTNPNTVAVSYGSYINRNSNETNGCVPTGTDPVSAGGLYTGVKTLGACKDDILLSVSSDGGQTFTGTSADPRNMTTVTSTSAQAKSDQWFQGMAYTQDGHLAISYYDRQYGNDEVTGFSDLTLSGSSDAKHFSARRVTTSSLPPPTQFGGVFWGDYASVDARDFAYPVWSDTRPQDIFLCPGSATGPGNPPRLCGLQVPAGPANSEAIFMSRVDVPAGG